LLIFSICSYAYALDPASHPIRQAGQVACPSRDFSEFIKAFSENTEMQAAFTKYPLQQQRLDANAEPEPKPVIRKLRRDQVSFPVLPNEAERKKQSLEVRVGSVIGSNAKAFLVKPDTDYKVTYEFELHTDSCWYLLSVDDQSLSGGNNAKTNWLEGIFPSMSNCTPSNFYFDKDVSRSNNGIPEKNNYRAYKIDGYFAKYKIREKFFGFDATEIAIPSNTDSIYTVTVQTDAKSLAEAIRNQTSYRPPIYRKKFKARSAMAYLVPESANKSTFVCFTFDGGF
jgi:hypothetical protein